MATSARFRVSVRAPVVWAALGSGGQGQKPQGLPNRGCGQAVGNAFPHRGVGARLGANHVPCVARVAG